MLKAVPHVAYDKLDTIDQGDLPKAFKTRQIDDRGRPSIFSDALL